MSQTKAILHYMEEGHRITPQDALRLFGCSRLSGRIKDIEEMTGRAPRREYVTVAGVDALGNPAKKRVMSYWIDKEES